MSDRDERRKTAEQERFEAEMEKAAQISNREGTFPLLQPGEQVGHPEHQGAPPTEGFDGAVPEEPIPETNLVEPGTLVKTETFPHGSGPEPSKK